MQCKKPMKRKDKMISPFNFHDFMGKLRSNAPIDWPETQFENPLANGKAIKPSPEPNLDWQNPIDNPEKSFQLPKIHGDLKENHQSILRSLVFIGNLLEELLVWLGKCSARSQWKEKTKWFLLSTFMTSWGNWGAMPQSTGQRHSLRNWHWSASLELSWIICRFPRIFS